MTELPMEPLKVCHIASGDRWAGAEVQVATLLRYLAATGEVKLMLAVLNEGRLAEEARASGVDVRVFPEATLGFSEIAQGITAWIRGEEVQVIHSHRYKENLLGVWVRRRCSVPALVRTQHGMPEPFAGWAHARHWLVQQVDWTAGRWFFDAVISVTAEMQPALEAKVGGKTVVIRNGVDLARLRSAPSPAEAKAALGIAPARLVIAAGGRLEPVKRLDVFLGALADVCRREPAVQGIVVGEGSEAPRLRALAETLGLGDRVRFLGHRDDIEQVLAAADLFAIPSDHEGLPMIMLECMALGVPVVARKVGGLAEVISDGADGVLVESADPALWAACWLELAADAGLRHRLAENAVETVRQRFSAERNTAETLWFYRFLWAKKR